MKKFLLFILILVALGGGAWYYMQKKRAAAAPDPELMGPRTVMVERGDIDLKVATTGKIIANLEVEVKSKASGQIIKLPFDISDEVTSGQLLAELDPVDENRNVAQREASLIASRARLVQAQEQFQIATMDLETGIASAQADLAAAKIKDRDSESRLARQEELYRKQLVSKEELEAARTETATAANALKQAEVKYADTKTLSNTLSMRKQEIELAKSDLSRANVDLDNAKQRLKETKIYAPMSGVVTARTVQTGQIIASGISNVGGGTSMLTVSDLSRMFVSASVDESDIGKIKEGQRALITVDAYPGKRFRGKVERIAAKGETVSNVVTFEVRIEIESEDLSLLKPEMTANVEIQADRRENVLLLPNDAVQYSREGYFVELIKGPDKSERQQVVTGLSDGLDTEIVEGVKEGDEVGFSSTVQSRWAQSGGPPGAGGRGGQSFDRGVRMMGYRMSGAGRRRGR